VFWRDNGARTAGGSTYAQASIVNAELSYSRWAFVLVPNGGNVDVKIFRSARSSVTIKQGYSTYQEDDWALIAEVNTQATPGMTSWRPKVCGYVNASGTKNLGFRHYATRLLTSDWLAVSKRLSGFTWDRPTSQNAQTDF
jgi:hypothetical protein